MDNKMTIMLRELCSKDERGTLNVFLRTLEVCVL